MDRAQTAQFYSGIAFGVAAAGFIAGVVEFVNAGRDERDAGSLRAGRADALCAGDDPRRTGEPRMSQGLDEDQDRHAHEGKNAPQGAVTA